MGIARSERPRLIGPLHPFDAETPALEVTRGLVEIGLVEHLEAEVASLRLVGFAQNDAVMTALLHRSQIDNLRRLVRDLQAERVDIEGPRPREVGDAIFDVAESNNVEGGIEIGRWQSHDVLL